MSVLEINLPELSYAVEEAMNRLRVNVKFSGNRISKLMVISSTPDEGKSTVALHLWRMLAEAGFKTVLVDLDLRKSELKHKIVNFTEDIKGSDYYLSGLANYDEILHSTNVPNGYMIPVSNVLQNPSTLLEDPRLAELLTRLKNEFKYVVVDVAPLMSVADGVIVGALCDSAIMVVRAGVTSKSLIKRSMNQLEMAGCKVMGTVLNGVEEKKQGYGYYKKYGEYYSNYYGDKK